ncbi:MAG: lysylphosphatidylglycerol synthase transmembrane domain-containing protein [Solirubrobacteraceae bacterium]
MTAGHVAEVHVRRAHDEHRLRRRLIGAVVVIAAVVSLLLAVPPLHRVANTIAHMGAGWLVLAVALEIGSNIAFVVIFRLFFERVEAATARELAWTEAGSGALLPGGGVGAMAAGGWLLHQAGVPTRRVIERSSGLFFLTSGANAAALLLGGVLLTARVGHGPHDLLRAVLPVIIAPIGIAVVLALPALIARGRVRNVWLRDLLCGIRDAQHALAKPSWRLGGAVGYLGFDIAVLWATFAATGHRLSVGALIVAYIVGYLANTIPIPGAVGVLEGGLAGMLILYGAPAAPAAGAVLVYHAIAFWVPSLGGVLAYWRLRHRLHSHIPGFAPTGTLARLPAAPAKGPRPRCPAEIDMQPNGDLS